MNNEQGFTLIELIIVITIVAILAAVALPRFIDAQRDARIAKATAIFGSIRSAAALARARCELDITQGLSAAGTCGNAAPAVTMDGAVVAMVNRYPSAQADGIERAAQIVPAADGLSPSGGGVNAGDTRIFDVNGGTVPNCRVSYEAASASGTGVAAPVITLVTSGC